jgi:hypothetical protein
MSENIKESVENIRDECDNIENEVSESDYKPKKAKTWGDPIVELHD